MPRPALLLLACLCLPCGPTVAGDTAWMLHLDRPAAVGDRCTVSATGKQNRRVETTSTSQPKEIATENLEVTYEALHEVRAIDSHGHPSEMLIRIDRLSTDDGSGPQEQFPAGTLIKATANGNETRYFHGRDELEGTLSDALNLAGTKLPSPLEPSEDAVFLNHVLRHPGQSWTADPKRLADAIEATSPFVIDPVTSTGEIRFEEPVTEKDIPALATTTTFRINPVSLGKSGLGQALTESSVTSTTLRLFPIDPSLPVVKETVDTSMKLIQRTSTGPKPTGTETTFQRQVTRHCLPVPQG